MAPPKGLESLVNHQMRRWEIQHPHDVSPQAAPCVAFSRLAGSGGEEIARRVAEWLDYGFFGTEIVEEIAKEQGIQSRLLVGLDERVRTVIDRYVFDAFRVRSFTESHYLQLLVRTIHTLGHRGMAVILGRGAPFILAPENALRILIIAPEELRRQRIAERKSLTLDQAAKELERLDARRDEFIRQHFQVNQRDPLHYDLILNTAHLSTDGAAGIAVDALRRRFPAEKGRPPAAAR